MVVGYVVARLIAQVFTKLSEKLGLQIAAERSGLADSMQHMGIERNVPAIVGTIVFWLLMCVFFMAAFNILGLQGVSDAMSEVVAVHPQAAGGHGGGGGRPAGGQLPARRDRHQRRPAGHLLCRAPGQRLLLRAGPADLHRWPSTSLGIEFHLLDNLILIACGGLALGFGLALGLGGRDVMAGILAGYYLRQRLDAGDQVAVAGMEGTVREVGPVATVIETEEPGLVNRHTVPNTKMLNEAVR